MTTVKTLMGILYCFEVVSCVRINMGKYGEAGGASTNDKMQSSCQISGVCH